MLYREPNHLHPTGRWFQLLRTCVRAWVFSTILLLKWFYYCKYSRQIMRKKWFFFALEHKRTVRIFRPHDQHNVHHHVPHALQWRNSSRVEVQSNENYSREEDLLFGLHHHQQTNEAQQLAAYRLEDFAMSFVRCCLLNLYLCVICLSGIYRWSDSIRSRTSHRVFPIDLTCWKNRFGVPVFEREARVE